MSSQAACISGYSVSISDPEYDAFRKLIHGLAGIKLGTGKRSLVCSRLSKRLRHYGLDSYSEYLALVNDPAGGEERQIMVDLLTTNETYFFREPRHFDFLREEVLPNAPPSKHWRIWSAASSSGEEAYTLAMLLAESVGLNNWEILGSDISQRVLERARRALYPLDAVDRIPRELLFKYCLKGVRTQSGYFSIDKRLRNKVSFQSVNLMQALPDIGVFDVIFLRNVMIYFDRETKRELVKRLVPRLRPGGYLFIGHSESLNGMCGDLKLLRPSIYQKPTVVE